MTKIVENEPGVVYCKPWGQDQGDYVRVNTSDFNPEIHELYEGAKAGGKPSDGLKVDEIKAALEAKGIAIPEGAKKPELAALLDAAE